MKYPEVSFGVTMGLAWLWATRILMFRVVFLFCWRIFMLCITLDLVGSWVELGFSVGVETAAAATLLQSCPTLCDPVDGSPPGSPIPGILQARTLEWVAISLSNL